MASELIAQQKYLKERLDSLSRSKNVFWGSGESEIVPKPAEVIAAEKRIVLDAKIVDRFKNKRRKANEQLKEKKKAAFEACRKAVYFETPEKALKLLEKFENEF